MKRTGCQSKNKGLGLWTALNLHKSLYYTAMLTASEEYIGQSVLRYAHL